jgi:predicted Fe-Mo cluster-binding NifX family protein
MKIAIASDGKKASQHFGHCEGFAFYEVEEGKIVNKSFIPNPGHRPGFLPKFLKEAGADVIISGGMGSSAQQLFIENNIEAIVGVEGRNDDLAQQYLKGELKS